MALLKKALVLAVTFASGICTVAAHAQAKKDIELNTDLMEATFMIKGPSGPGRKTLGTAFLMGRPFANNPRKARYVLITAAHVLRGIQGEFAILMLRRETETGNWIIDPFPLEIRAAGRPLWKTPPGVDVAVMYVRIPKTVASDIPLLPTTLLADDAMLSQFEIHPGDELECLGYPLGAMANPAGFPILRSGKIASYPLLPTGKVKTFLFDFRVFNGNSGGPVYFVQSGRNYGGAIHLNTVHFIMGLVTEQEFASVPFIEQNAANQNSMGVKRYPLGLGVVIDASLIRKAIALLPPPESVSPKK